MPRKKPFSGKQKKKQLREKRDRKADNSRDREAWKAKQDKESDASSAEESGGEIGNAKHPDITAKLSKGAEFRGRRHDEVNRYRLNFLRESREELERRKFLSQTTPLVDVPPEQMESRIEDVYQPGTELDMPCRPEWKYGSSKEKLERNEEKYFRSYLDGIYTKFGDHHLSYFEHNLETWRQLWRVLERSDVVAMVADVRHPVLHFSPALYNHVTNTLRKPLILVLNKTDLVPAPVVVAWKAYFRSVFPKLHVVLFTSFPKDVRGVADPKKLKKRRPVGKRVYTTQIGPLDLFRVCANLCDGKVDLASWEEKIRMDTQELQGDNVEAFTPSSGEGANEAESCDFTSPSGEGADKNDAENHSMKIEKLSEEGHLTIGFVGHPNVGKSSLMNGLIGKKVVSTSVTPGHTKYFQTYFLTPTVMLCDCPGLVFPSLIEKQMQILSGIYPISQVQEPYTPVGYLASRIPLVKLLRLTHPGDEPNAEWTAWDVCEAWAEKRGFYTAKGSRPDVYRAANHILRMAVDGRLCMYMLPPNYTREKKKWFNHPETRKLLTFSLKPGEKLPPLEHDAFHAELVNSEIESIEASSNESDSSEEGADRGDTGAVAMENKFAILCGDD